MSSDIIRILICDVEMSVRTKSQRGRPAEVGGNEFVNETPVRAVKTQNAIARKAGDIEIPVGSEDEIEARQDLIVDESFAARLAEALASFFS